MIIFKTKLCFYDKIFLFGHLKIQTKLKLAIDSYYLKLTFFRLVKF